jgi:hypothetical protein
MSPDISSGSESSDYEATRAKNIEKNRNMIASLGLAELTTRPVRQKRKRREKDPFEEAFELGQSGNNSLDISALPLSLNDEASFEHCERPMSPRADFK